MVDALAASVLAPVGLQVATGSACSFDQAGVQLFAGVAELRAHAAQQLQLELVHHQAQQAFDGVALGGRWCRHRPQLCRRVAP